MENTENNHFNKINNFYAKYISLLGKDNVEVALKTLEEKIATEICKVFYLDSKGFAYLDDEERHEKKIQNKEYSYEIFMKSIECLKYYSRKKNDETGNFASFTISSINKMLNSLKAQNTLEEKNSGVKIPREKNLLVRKIKNMDVQLLRDGIKNSRQREVVLQKKFDLTEKELNELMPLVRGEKISLNSVMSDDGERATLGDFQESNFTLPSDLLESKESITEIFTLIQKEWEKSNDTDRLLSDILTADILGNMFDSRSHDTGDYNANPDSESLDFLSSFSFFNQDMLTKFFTDFTYKLPTQTEIGQIHGGMTKSGISKKVSRFYEKVKNNGISKIFGNYYN